jgi:hypothetical protein
MNLQQVCLSIFMFSEFLVVAVQRKAGSQLNLASHYRDFEKKLLEMSL